MKYFAWVCAVILLEGIAFGQQGQPQGQGASNEPAKSATASDLGNLFEAKIKAEWQAIKDKDQKALGALLAEDFVGVEADGRGERYKWKALSELADSAVTDFTLSFLKVTPLCADAAFVRYEVFVRFPPKSAVPFEKILVGEVWIKREGLWRALHYQETKVK